MTYTVYNDANHETRIYPGFNGTTTTGPITIHRQYWPAAGSGDSTSLLYDPRGRQDETIEPTGTIDITVFDPPGRVSSKWVGTNATPGSVKGALFLEVEADRCAFLRADLLLGLGIRSAGMASMRECGEALVKSFDSSWKATAEGGSATFIRHIRHARRAMLGQFDRDRHLALREPYRTC